MASWQSVLGCGDYEGFAINYIEHYENAVTFPRVK